MGTADVTHALHDWFYLRHFSLTTNYQVISCSSILPERRQCLNLGQRTGCSNCAKLALQTAGNRYPHYGKRYPDCGNSLSRLWDTGYPECRKPFNKTVENRLSTLRETGYPDCEKPNIQAAGNRLSILRETGYRDCGKPAIQAVRRRLSRVQETV
jgi:hypothetical protein